MNGGEAIAGPFELVNPHSRGNMGEVRRSPDLQIGDTVALKLIRPCRTDGPAPRLSAGHGEVPPDGLVRVHCLGTRAQAPLPGHQPPAGSCPLVPVPAPVRVRLVRSLHVHTMIRTLVCSYENRPGPYESSLTVRIRRPRAESLRSDVPPGGL